jgi:multiple sugar transport system permease protein
VTRPDARALARPRRPGVELDLGLVNAFLLVGALVMVFPFLWMVLSSLKSNAEIIAVPPTLLPQNWQW